MLIMPHARPYLLIFIACLYSFFSVCSYASNFVETNASILYDDNLGRAEQDADIRGDSALQLSVSAGKVFHPSVGNSLVLKTNLQTTQWFDVTDLSQFSLGIMGQFTHKFGLGALTPRVSASLSIDYADFRSDIRDSWIYRAETRLDKRLDEYWELHGGIAYKISRAREEGSSARPPFDVFDQQRFSVFMGGDYALTEDVLLSATYRYHNGDIDSTATAPNARFLNASTARAIDDAFGNDKVVYKLDSNTQDVTLEANWILTDNTALTMGYEYLLTTATDEIEYKSNLLRLSIFVSF
ncbi:hypothetical protein [Beggiatoa leptomitoformis]|uniref:DUF481 domain-containing protein n=1 Tax=Beggiatoa leptomitoformis TaxID=288004 RepID=A0A2N9YHS4_9GAMM|nr:hypothetical protein [Beggiatoa leptomitoformis]ALG67801.1 hypothetical protein AL038_08905 [Beggiatoa leptomitoformis]AUI69949.1 hypothetical protein BLE401_15405 [Beggiatoa leptomitoformis]